jgi:hypothetical protein
LQEVGDRDSFETYSCINEGRQVLIDHVLVSHALVGTLVEAATNTLDLQGVGTHPQITPAVDRPSEHRPVVARFDI